MTASASQTKSGALQAPLLRRLLAVASVLGVLTAAVIAAVALRPESAAVGGIEQLSAASASYLARLGRLIPLGYAFGAGMVSAVNPCGFALLPAYLGLYLRAGEAASAGERLARAALVGVTVTATFMVVFGVVGLALMLVGAALGGFLPWAGLAVGVILVVIGGSVLGGHHLNLGLAQHLGDRIGVAAQSSGVRAYAAYGLAYAVGSLGCTLPVFLAVVGIGLGSQGAAGAALQLLLYGLGMGTVLTLLALAAALLRRTAFRNIRSLGRLVEPLSAGLLLVTGGYVVFYWLSPGGTLAAIGALAAR